MPREEGVTSVHAMLRCWGSWEGGDVDGDRAFSALSVFLTCGESTYSGRGVADTKIELKDYIVEALSGISVGVG